MSSPQTHILILAAGSSSRMRGADKLMEPVGGRPLLAHLAAEAAATGLPVTVVLPPDRPLRRAAIRGLGVAHLIAPQASRGMAISLRTGLAALPDDAPVMLILADLPDLTRADIARMARAAEVTPEAILRGASATGQPGHPVLFPPWVRPDLLSLDGDEGARSVLQRHQAMVRLVPLPGQHAVTDLDTPEDWARWRALRGQ